jgi:hypothetical protein
MIKVNERFDCYVNSFIYEDNLNIKSGKEINNTF